MGKNIDSVKSNQKASELILLLLLESDSETEQEITYTVTAKKGSAEFKEENLTEIYGYNGSYLGPILRIKKGQNIRINLNNNLSDETTFH